LGKSPNPFLKKKIKKFLVKISEKVIILGRERSKQIMFFVNEEEYEAIQQRVKMTRLNRSDYLRTMALKGIIYQEDLESIRQLAYEINKIGVNINQIAKLANEKGTVYKWDLNDIRKKLDQIYRLFGEIAKPKTDKEIRKALKKELEKIKKEIHSA